jgi:murein L,D-transpeptidase YcbB/YkuD
LWISVIPKCGNPAGLDLQALFMTDITDNTVGLRQYAPIRHRFITAIITLLCSSLAGWLLPGQTMASHYFFPQVRARIESQVQAEINLQGFMCRGELICGLQVIPIFYQNRSYDPVWFDFNGLRPTVRPLITSIQNADREGLTPSDYHLATLEQLLAELTAQTFPPDESQANAWADFDLILTDAFLLLGSHLSGGRINPETLHADWLINERSIDMLAFLETAATEEQMEKAIQLLRPEHSGYSGLVAALQQMRNLENYGGWPQLEHPGTLRPADRNDSVATLRKRMLISGDLSASTAAETTLGDSDLYDATLAAAVKNFQRRHGLEADGVVGRKTREVMNITATQRVRQIELNLERWRWLPRNLGERYIEVNTADFSLHVMERHQKVLDMRVVVGRPARRTPVFSTTMSYLVFNPYWTVPLTIAVEDILPKLTESIDYLVRQNIKVYADWSENAPEIDPHSISWRDYNKNYFPLRLRQEPGKSNALGQIKFIFPNKFAVYLHDTPQRSLFNRVQRDFSSGCIRVQDAPALAYYLLSDDPSWTHARLQEIFEGGQRQVVRLPRPIPVHLLYMTAWVDENDGLQFRNDIYHRDRDLNAALLKRAPYHLPPLSDDE